MFQYITSKKNKLLTFSMIIFIFILGLFGGANIYNSCKILNDKVNSNFIFLTEGIKKSANRYFYTAESETEHCREIIKITVNNEKLKQIATVSHLYNENKIPYIGNYLKSTVAPILLYSAAQTDGLMGVYFDFDHELLKHKNVIGLWYIKSNDNKSFKLIDSGVSSSMYPETRDDLKWFYVPKKLKKGIWSEPYIDDDLKINMITYSTPVYSNNNFLGIIGMDISMDELRNFLLKFKIYNTGKIYLINKDNKIIFAQGHNPKDSTATINQNLYNYLDKISAKNIIMLDKDIKLIKSSDKKLFAITSLYNGFILVLEVPENELYGEINKLISFTALSLILAILISMLIAIEAYARIKKINNELIHKEKLISMGTMAAEVTHEMNTPLGYVNCNIDTLKKFMDKIKTLLKSYEIGLNNIFNKKSSVEAETKYIDDLKSELKIDYVLESIDDLIDESKDGINKVSEIIKNLKRFSKNDSQDLKTEENLESIINNSIKILRNKIPSAIKIQTNFQNMPPLICYKNQIGQVLINMIENAYQSIEEKNDTDKKIIISAYKKGKNAHIEIEDTGMGIDKNKINKIFTAFFTTKARGIGTGLGLSVAYEIINNKHNGEILVESKKGKGTKFIIKIPYQKGSE